MNILSLFVYIYFHFSWWCKYLGVGLLAHEYIPFKEIAKHFSKVVVQLHVPASGISEFSCSTSLIAFGLSVILSLAILVDMK